jgi:peptide/nickel transport system substrate-binding protein
MERDPLKRLDEYRLTQADSLENTLIDEFLTGQASRADFLRHASVIGLSATAVGAALGTAGYASASVAVPRAVKAGGRLRLGVIPGPTGDLEPHQFADHGRLATGTICGEFLTQTNQDNTLSPRLALNWKTNKDGTQWAFNLRKGVKFQDGSTFTAADVVATFNRCTDPNGGSGALSAFKGVLKAGNIKAANGGNTVVFYLDAPTASFPYLTSNTTYQSIILPSTYKLGGFAKGGVTTGAFRMTSYTPGIGAKFDRYTGWWGGSAPLDGVDVTYYSDEAAVVAALLGGQIDLISQVSFSGGRALFNNSKVQIITAKGTPHREISMLVSTAAAIKPFKDRRVRQALALTLDRPKIIKQLFNGFAVPGNDSPFAAVYPSSDPTVPQRKQDLVQAKKLLAQAGYPKGFAVTLTTEKYIEIPQLAQILAASAKKVGINIKLNIITSDAYYGGTYSGGATGRGTTPWLNTPLNITDYGHRAVPNVVLSSAFKTGGVWSSSNYANPAFDKAVESYTAALTLKEQRKYSGIAARMLLRDTPVVIPYFYNWTMAGSKKVKGFKASAIGTIDLSKTSLA